MSNTVYFRIYQQSNQNYVMWEASGVYAVAMTLYMYVIPSRETPADLNQYPPDGRMNDFVCSDESDDGEIECYTKEDFDAFAVGDDSDQDDDEDGDDEDSATDGITSEPQTTDSTTVE
jgi:hypothetical protein